MKRWIAFWNILRKDMRAYYLKPPNISWGLIFPLGWTGMFSIKSGGGPEDVLSVLPGVVAVSVLFGTTSMLPVTVTFRFRDAAVFFARRFSSSARATSGGDGLPDRTARDKIPMPVEFSRQGRQEGEAVGFPVTFPPSLRRGPSGGGGSRPGRPGRPPGGFPPFP